MTGQHLTWPPNGQPATHGTTPPPGRCPFQIGQWVQCHGYPGEIPGPQQWGFRGIVLGALGGTVLHGITDGGLSWAVPWGALVRDGARDGSAARCSCCPRPGAAVASGVEQLDLFAGVAA